MDPDVRLCADILDLSRRVAAAVAGSIDDAVRQRGRCAIALSGGETPRTLYGLLASEFNDQIPWSRVHIFWSDERYVPAADPRSNYGMAKAMLLDRVPCPPDNIHPMPTHFANPDRAADDYAGTLRGFFATGPPRFDLILLGLGADGHTASLFPGSPALIERERSVVAVRTTVDPPVRLTLTLPALTDGVAVHVLVSGSNKADALRHVLADDAKVDRYPAAGLRAAKGSVTWWVDRATVIH